MRTTLAIDDDVLAAAKHLAERDRKSVGEVISTWPGRAWREQGALYASSATAYRCCPAAVGQLRSLRNS